MPIHPLAALLFAAAQAASAPAASPAEVPRQLTVTVTDERGAAVEGLTASDVVVLENGVARAVTELERDTRPLTLAVILDSSEPMSSVFRLHVLEPVTQFLQRLPEGTRFSIWTTGDRPTRVVAETDDAAAAIRALRRVFPQGGNTLLDALVEVSRDLRQKEGARTAVVVVTGLGIGFRNYDRRFVVDEALKSGATFYVLAFEDNRVGPGAEGAGQGDVEATDYDYVLSNLARRSAGLRETTLSAMGVASLLPRLAAGLRGQYRLEYRGLPGAENPKLEVTVARPGAKVQVRSSRP
jgi:VWFA-related protein